ncbi:hypothetical protein C8Q80DRAFT_266432 [Daedaleopsis nitida]|nr:hypothetical protein C8Q80DRAFT_266432 [Daedaleopsis nitida]
MGDFIDRSMDVRAERGLFTPMLPRDRDDSLVILRQATHAEFATLEQEPQIIAESPEGGRIALGLWLDGEFDIYYYANAALIEFGDLFKEAPLEDVSIMCSPESELDPRVWSHVFASLPSVRSLEVFPSCELHPVCTALSGALEAQDDPCVSARLLPQLRSVQLLKLLWADDVPDLLLECMCNRALRGLPRLEHLETMFVGTSSWDEDGEALVDTPLSGKTSQIHPLARTEVTLQTCVNIRVPGSAACAFELSLSLMIIMLL